MPTEAKARAQYGDYGGTIMADGFNGSIWSSIEWDCPGGYVPVGFEFYKCESGELLVYILAADCEQVGGVWPHVAEYCKANNELTVFRFESKLTVMDILPKLKRLNVVVQDRCTKGVPLMVVE